MNGNTKMDIIIVGAGLRDFLFQPGQRLFDAGDGFFDVGIGSGIRQADAVGGTKGGSTYASYMTYLEQVHGQLGGVVDDAVAIALAKVGLALGKYVEGSLRLTHLEAGDFAHQADNEVAAALEGLAHVLDTLLAAGIGHSGGFLRNGAGT